MSEPTEDLLKAAEDLADAFDIPVEVVAAKLRTAMEGEHQPLRLIKRMPWYLQLPMPTKWRQRWIMRQIRSG